MNLNLCIVLNKPVVYSETFIKAHVDHLDAKVVYTKDLPFSKDQVGNSPAKGITGKTWVFAKKAKTLLADRSKAKKLDRFFLQNKIQLVMAEYGNVGVEVMPYCKRRSIPLVVHFHGYDAFRKPTLERFADSYKELFHYAKAIIVVSKDMYEQVIRLGAPAEKVHYNVYGVELERFPACNVQESAMQVLAVGRFVEKKAPYLTILAFQEVLKSVPNARLVMVGDGPLWDVCRKMVHALGLDQRISLVGSLPHSEVASLMHTSRVFVQHSLIPMSGDSEGTPNTILEAQASGIPIVSTRHAGIKDVVVHGKTGFLVDEGDIHTMAHHMAELLDNPGMAAVIGHNGRMHVSQNYSMEKSIASLGAILEKCKK